MKRNTPIGDEQIFYTETDEFPGKEEMLVHSFIHKNCNVCTHTHDFYEINVVVSGSGTHYIGEMEVPLTGGEVFVLPPNVAHGYECIDSLNVEHVIIKVEFLEKYLSIFEKLPGYSAFFEIEPYLRQVNENKLFLKLEGQELENVKEQIFSIREQNEKMLYSYQTVIALKLICELCLTMDKQRNSAATDETGDSDIIRVMEYIHAHFDEKLSIDFLAKIANMSRPTLHRHFRAITLMTPLDYIIQYRITEAKKLLEKENISRAEVAQRCGFYDTSHMNKYLM